ncbi:MAG: GIY-YIG nuclease family protein [Tenuifilaceae bacterium]|nr:GIY-YIG nuclease family protein [Tenuifilaceae bacterium]
MAYIYRITNLVNNKSYVGKTSQKIEVRFNEHVRESKKERSEKRPLYEAIQKYGAENFIVELIEECSGDDINEREIFWISKLETFKTGYNITLGGDGTRLYNYKDIADKYLEIQNQAEVARFFNCDVKVVKHACDECKILLKTGAEIARENKSKKVQMFSLNQDFLRQFSSIMEASIWLKENSFANGKETTIVGHISEVCKGKRKTAYKHIWRYA